LVKRILAPVIIPFLRCFRVWQSSTVFILYKSHSLRLFIMCFVWWTCGWSIK